MRKSWAIIIPLVVLAIIIGLTVGLYLLGDAEASALEKFRDIMIVYLGFLWVIVVLLVAILVGVLVWVALLIKDKVIPLLQQIQETMVRVKGTAEFMSEEVASPVIGFYGSMAKARRMSQVITERRPKQKNADQDRMPGKVKQILRRPSK
ncbi:hypothetical protein BH20CHL1_BH20CHL1_00430 [soil metagenome]